MWAVQTNSKTGYCVSVSTVTGARAKQAARTLTDRTVRRVGNSGLIKKVDHLLQRHSASINWMWAGEPRSTGRMRIKFPHPNTPFTRSPSGRYRDLTARPARSWPD